MSYMSYPQRSTWLEFLGFPPGYGPWTYRAIPEPLISSELARLASAHIINGKTTTTDCISLQPSPDPDDRSQDRFVVLDWDGWSFSAVFDGKCDLIGFEIIDSDTCNRSRRGRDRRLRRPGAPIVNSRSSHEGSGRCRQHTPCTLDRLRPSAVFYPRCRSSPHRRSHTTLP